MVSDMLDYVFAFAAPTLAAMVFVDREGKKLSEEEWFGVGTLALIGAVSLLRAVGVFA